MREKLKEIRGRVLEAYLKGLVVKRLHAKLIDWYLAGGNFLGIPDGIEDAGVTGSRLRVHDTAEGKHEIARSDGIAIRPFGIFAHMECVGETVFGNIPRCSRAGDGLALLVLREQTFIKVAQDTVFRNGGRVVLVQRGGVGIVTPVEHCFCRCSAAERHQANACHQESANHCKNSHMLFRKRLPRQKRALRNSRKKKGRAEKRSPS